MNRQWIFGLMTALGLTAMAWCQDAQTLLDDMDNVLVPQNYSAQLTMTTNRPGKAAIAMSFTLDYKQGTGSLMEILTPARSKGTRFLQKDKALWLYSPRSGSSRPIRLSPKQSFQGSVFSNGDVSEPRYSRDYAAQISGKEQFDHSQLGTVTVIVLEGHPKSAAAEYGLIKAWILPDSHMPLRIEYTAKSGLLFKRMDFSGFRQLAGTQRPSIYRMESLEESGSFTTLSYESLTARQDLADRIFTESWLTR